jgi:hypothetical protein
MGARRTGQPVCEHLAVLEATEQPRRHDRADQRRKQVGRKEPELSREDGRPELAGGVDAAAGDGAEAGDGRADEAADKPRDQRSQPGYRQEDADEQDDHRHAGGFRREERDVGPAWRRPEGGVDDGSPGHGRPPCDTRQQHAQQRARQLSGPVGQDAPSGKDSKAPHGQRYGRVDVPAGGLPQRAEDQPGEQQPHDDADHQQLEVNPGDSPRDR